MNTATHQTQTLGADRSINSLTLGRGGYNISGNTLLFYNSGAGITSTGNNTIGSDLFTIVPSTFRSDGGTLTLAGGVNVANPNTATLTGSGNFTVNGIVQQNGGLIMSGTGTLLLNGANTNLQATTVNSGTLKPGNVKALGSGPLFIYAPGVFDATGVAPSIPYLYGDGSILAGANTLTLSPGSTWGYDTAFSGSISGTGGVVLQLDARSIQVFSGTSTYTGGTTVKSGFLSPLSDAALGDTNGFLKLDGGGIAFEWGGTLSRPVLVGSNGATFVTAYSTSYLPASISGGGPVTYGGLASPEGTWVATGNNTYTGSTTLGGGNLAISDDSQLGAPGTPVKSTGGSLFLRGGVTVSGRTLTLAGVGNSNDGAFVNDSGNNAWTGPIISSFGSVGVPHAGETLTLSGPITGTASLGITCVGDAVISGDLSVPLDKAGSGSLTLSGNNTASGDVFVWAGNLYLSGGNAISDTRGLVVYSPAAAHLLASETIGGFSDNGISGSTIDLGPYDLTLTNSGAFYGSITGTGRLIMNGSGTLNLAGTNSFSGGLYVNAGTLVLTSDAGLGAANNPIYLANGALSVLGSTYTSTSRTFIFQGADLTLNTGSGASFTFGQNLNNTGKLIKTGDGTLTLSSAVNDYGGGTTLLGGTLSVNSDAQLGNGGAVTFNGGTLQITGTNFHSTSRPMVWGQYYSGINIADAANTFTIAQATSQRGGLAKSGAGTLVLSAVADFSSITAGAGTLQLGAAAILTTADSVGVGVGATLDCHGFDQSVKSLFLSGKMTTGAGLLTLSNQITSSGQDGLLTGKLSLNNQAVTFYVNSGQPGPGLLNVAAPISSGGTIVKAGLGTLLLSGSSSYTGGINVNAGQVNISGTINHAAAVTIAAGAVLELENGSHLAATNITNNGFLRFIGTSGTSGSGVITNYGVIDITHWFGKLPLSLVNAKGGIIIDANSDRVTMVSRLPTSVQLTVRGQAGLTYQLQRAVSLTTPVWTNVNGQSKAAAADGDISFTDVNPLAAPAFYRLQISLTPTQS